MQEAQFDGSIDLLIRINGIIYKINHAKDEHDAKTWLKLLKNYHDELYPLLTDDEEAKVAELTKKANQKVAELDESMSGEAYTALREFERKLRKLQHTHSLYVRTIEKVDMGTILLQ